MAQLKVMVDIGSYQKGQIVDLYRNQVTAICEQYGLKQHEAFCPVGLQHFTEKEPIELAEIAIEERQPYPAPDRAG